ncbi:cobalt transporter subunit CbtA [Hoeflea marina]|uniref:Cobalt transporter subunit CbtA n=1 Tax=Hoeflea marina TaxID=274592 RepID=A0A317PK81_9HYPH|nr:CbtA family protein [Hoeflea marina]PWV98989.1 cobalt transporter subunit CbtA [Hoeflea marina]
MIVRFLLAALAAGLIAGLAMTPAQYIKIVPLILQAEAYEGGGSAAVSTHDHGAGTTEVAGHDHGAATPAGHAHANTDAAAPASAAPEAHSHDHGDGESVLGLGRLGNTVLANLAAGGGFGLMLAAAALLLDIRFGKGKQAVGRGLLLGAAGWFAVQLAPAWGLPPELPGFPEIDLQARQTWWMITVALSAAGIWLVALRPEWIAKSLGVVLIVAPHVYGAPQPADISSAVPAFLAAEYTVASLATTLGFWLLLGGLLGHFLSRVDEGASV